MRLSLSYRQGLMEKIANEAPGHCLGASFFGLREDIHASKAGHANKAYSSSNNQR